MSTAPSRDLALTPAGHLAAAEHTLNTAIDHITDAIVNGMIFCDWDGYEAAFTQLQTAYRDYWKTRHTISTNAGPETETDYLCDRWPSA